MRHLLIICLLLAALLILLAATGCGAAVNDAVSVATDSHRRYHDGERWIEVTVALDRLHLERTGADAASAGVEVYLLRTPVASVAALEDVARQMTAAQPDIRRISAYLITGDSPATQPARLTKRVAVRGAPGQDLEQLAARHRCRLVQRVEYSPDTAILESESSALLAALDVADAVRQETGIVFATPLFERSVALRSAP